MRGMWGLVRQVTARSSWGARTSVLRRPKSVNAAAAAVDDVAVHGEGIRPRLDQLRRQLEVDHDRTSPRQFAATASSADSLLGPEVPAFDRVRAQIATASAAFPEFAVAAANGTDRSAVLQDTFGRQHSYLRISLTERCNLRCTYCMPEEGVPLQEAGQLLSHQEIVRLATIFAECGVDKIRLTGGEPTLRADLIDIVRDLAAIPGIREVGMTTNAVKLKPQLQAQLRDAGLTAMNISLDTLVAAKFAKITRRSPKILDRVMAAIHGCAETFPGRVKVNCVVMKGFNCDELQDFVRLGQHTAVDVRFIEWMPFSGNKWDERFMSYAEMQAAIAGSATTSDGGEAHASESGGGEGFPGFVLHRDTDGANDTTKWWRARATASPTAASVVDDAFLGRVGFITSMSANFCSTCNRLRLMADGKIKACLFGEDELSLRDALREPTTTEAEVRLLIHSAVAGKTFALGGHGDMHGIAASAGNRPMTLIGG